jgi:hypothetical protein
MKNKISAVEMETILSLYDDGVPTSVIAKILDLEEYEVVDILEDHGITKWNC